MPFHLSWFPFYYNDFFMSGHVQVMSREQKCMYLELLALQWCEGSIPSSKRHIAAALHINDAKLAEVWPELEPCFVKAETGGRKGRLINLRLHEERELALELDKKKKKWSAMANASRWANTPESPTRTPNRIRVGVPQDSILDPQSHTESQSPSVYPEAEEMAQRFGSDNHKKPPR